MIRLSIFFFLVFMSGCMAAAPVATRPASKGTWLVKDRQTGYLYIYSEEKGMRHLLGPDGKPTKDYP